MMRQDTMHWVVAAPFFGSENARWLDDFVSDNRFSFTKVAPAVRLQSWHSKRSRVTGLTTWISYLRQAWAAFERCPDGVVTCFPQLAMCAAMLKRLGSRKPLIIAYNYNLGALPSGWRRRLARFVATEVDCFVVHSPQERESYAAYLDVSLERIVFVPLQRGEVTVPRCEETEAPFVLAMGSAQRDYESLIAAVDALGLSTTIVTRADDAACLPHSRHVTFLSGLSEADCLELLARARLSVTPISNLETASGQITFVNAMMLGVAVIATECPGTNGYVRHRETGVLVPPFDAKALEREIGALWQDPQTRNALAAAGQAEAQARFSDAAAADQLTRIMAGLCFAQEHTTGVRWDE